MSWWVVPALVTAGLLALAGATKVLDPSMTTGALRAAGLSASDLLVRVGAAAELGIGVAALVVGGFVPWLLVSLSYVAFTWFVARALVTGAPIGSCGCFGRADTEPRWDHVVIDVVLWAAVVPVGIVLEGSPVDAVVDHPQPGALAVALAGLGIGAVYVAFTRRSPARATR